MKIIDNYITEDINGKFFDEIKIYGIKGNYSQMIDNNLMIEIPIEYNSGDHVRIFIVFKNYFELN